MKIILPWKEFNLNLSVIEAHLKAQYPTFTGICSDVTIRLGFTSLTQQEEHAVLAYMASITEESPEAEYVSKEQIALQKEELKEQAKTTLLSLGLTEAQLAALLGT